MLNFASTLVSTELPLQFPVNPVANVFILTDRTFYVVVVPLKRTSGTVKNLKNPDEMDMEEVGYFESKRCEVILAQHK